MNVAVYLGPTMSTTKAEKRFSFVKSFFTFSHLTACGVSYLLHILSMQISNIYRGMMIAYLKDCSKAYICLTKKLHKWRHLLFKIYKQSHPALQMQYLVIN